MNLLEMAGRFRAFVGDEHSDKYTLEFIKEYLNDAQESVQNMMLRASGVWECSSAQHTVTASATTDHTETLPAGFRKIVRVEKVVSGSDNIKLFEVDLRQRVSYGSWDFLWESGVNRATEYYYLKGNDTIGYVLPSGYTANVFYESQYTAMSDENDECGAPIAFHNLVVLMAVDLAAGLEGRKISPALERRLGAQQSLFMTFITKRSGEPQYADD